MVPGGNTVTFLSLRAGVAEQKVNKTGWGLGGVEQKVNKPGTDRKPVAYMSLSTPKRASVKIKSRKSQSKIEKESVA